MTERLRDHLRTPELAPSTEQVAEIQARLRRRRRARRTAAVVLPLAALIPLAVWLAPRRDEAGLAGARIVSREAPVDVAMRDGSTVALAPATHIRVDTDPTADAAESRVSLLEGEAHFEVERRPRRFIVRAGDVEVIVLGTAFTVQRRGGAVSVAVQRGRVQVDDGQGSRVLEAGDRWSSNAAAQGSAQGSARGSAQGSAQGSARGSEAVSPTNEHPRVDPAEDFAAGAASSLAEAPSVENPSAVSPTNVAPHAVSPTNVAPHAVSPTNVAPPGSAAAGATAAAGVAAAPLTHAAIDDSPQVVVGGHGGDAPDERTNAATTHAQDPTSAVSESDEPSEAEQTSEAAPEANASPAVALLERARVAAQSGREREAASTYEALLRDHPRDARAGLAAFELARLRMDRLGDPRGALRPLRIAITRGLRASYREDAMARLTEAYLATDNTQACQDARRRYLRAYPSGVHAAQVRARCP